MANTSLLDQFGRPLMTTRPEVHREYGWGGAPIMAGVVRDEHNRDLQGRAAVQMAARMRRADAQVAATYSIVTLPIRATEWSVEPGAKGSAEQEAAELLQRNLFGGMEHSFDDFLREGLLAVYYGFRVPEIVWDEEAGLITIRKVAGRNLERIERWLYDEAGRLVGYLYTGNRPVGYGLQEWSTQSSVWERVPVPLEKTLHFVWDREEDNPQGRGIWRAQYPHWYRKERYYKIVALGAERNYLDVPVGKVPEGTQEEAVNAFLLQLARWRAAENAALVLRGEEAVEWHGSQRGLMDIMPIIQHEDAKIAQVGLAQFMNLGQTQTGTQALAEELVDVFKMGEDAVARWFAATVNAQLVRRWTLANYGPALVGPRLVPAPLRGLEVGALGPFLTAATTGGYLHPLPEDEAKLRRLLQFPEIPLEQLQANAAQRQPAPGPNAQPRQMTEPGARAGGRECDGCRSRVFVESEAEQDARRERVRQEQDFADRARGVLETLQEGFLAALRPLVEDHQNRDKISKGIPLVQLAEVEVPGARTYAEFVRSYLWDVLQQGRKALALETGQDVGDRPVSNRLRSWVTAKAQVIADSHVGQLRSAVLDRVLTGVRAEMEPSQIFSDAGSTAVEVLTRAAREDWSLAAAEILSALPAEGRGRWRG